MNRLSLPGLISLAAFVTGFVLLWPGDLFFLDKDFSLLYSVGTDHKYNAVRFISDITLQLDYFIWKKDPIGYHITNALLHIIATILMYRFTKLLLHKYTGLDERNHVALLSSALFFVFAYHSESLYWINARPSTLATIFFLLSATLYLRRENSKLFSLSQFFFFVGLFTYESVWILPIVFFLISWADVKSNTSVWRKEIKLVLLSLLIFTIYFITRYFLADQFDKTFVNGFIQFDIPGLLTNYIKLIGRTFAVNARSIVLIVVIALVALLSLVNLFASKNRNRLFHTLLLGLWLISYLPYISLDIDISGTLGERYLYLPSIFFCIWVANSLFSAKEPIWKNILGVAFFGLHIAMLYEHRHNYEIASISSRLTIDAINDQQELKLLQIENLPQQNRGALIFRNGFNEALLLFKKPGTVDSVQVISRSPINFESYPLIDVQQINPSTSKMSFETDPDLEF